MTYFQTKSVVVLFLLVYAGIGIGAHLFADRVRGVYPFFSWFLFVEIPPRIQTNFELFVIEFQGKTISPSVSLKDLSGFSLGEGNTKKFFYLLIDQLGRAIQNGNPKEIKDTRLRLESLLVGISMYEVREVLFNPIERLRSGAVLSESTIGTFKIKPQ